MAFTVGELAKKLGATVEGDASRTITGVAGIREAGNGDITFVADARYADAVAATKASAVVVAKTWDRSCPAPMIRVDNVEHAFTQIALWFAPPPVKPAPGVHPTAVVAAGVQLGEGVSIGPHCVLEPGVKVGARTVLFAGCYLGHGVTVGSDSRLYPHVSVREHGQIGDRTIIHNGTVIGSDGFGYAADQDGVRKKIPQIGIVVIGNDVEIGANVAIDRARFGKTQIGNGVKIDNLVQIAHNVVIGDHAVIVAQVGIAGSCHIGAHAILAGQVGVAGHLVIGDGAIVEAQSGILRDVPPKARMFGSPAWPADQAMRSHAVVMRLPELRKQVLEIGRRLAAIEKKLQQG